MRLKDKIHVDFYFERGHLLKKIWQTLVALFFWIIMLIPCVITIGSYIAYLTNGKKGFYFWHYLEGFRELNFLIILILFINSMVAVYCLTVAFVQNQRRKQLTEKWPMYDIQKSNKDRIVTEGLATVKFGPKRYRHHIKYCVIKSEQNFKKNELRKYVR